jgi:hypothetical protein
MAFQVVVKVRDSKKVRNLRALSQQIASLLEQFTGKRTVLTIKDFGKPK